MYIKKVLGGLLIMVLAISLTGCFAPRRVEFPTTETGFPIGFTRLSDGAQIYLGMTRDEVGEILYAINMWGDIVESQGERVNYGYFQDALKLIDYNEDDGVVLISSTSEDWAIAGGISVGDSILVTLVSDSFPIPMPRDYGDSITFGYDDDGRLVYYIIFGRDGSGYLPQISLGYLSE